MSLDPREVTSPEHLDPFILQISEETLDVPYFAKINAPGTEAKIEPLSQGAKRWLPERPGHVDFGGGHVDFKFTCPMGM